MACLGKGAARKVEVPKTAPQVTDTTTFTDEARRAEVDAWLYDTCTQCLQHLVDLVVQFYPAVQPLMSRILQLLADFIRCAAQPPPTGSLPLWDGSFCSCLEKAL